MNSPKRASKKKSEYKVGFSSGKSVQRSLQFGSGTNPNYAEFLRMAYLGSNNPYLPIQLVKMAANPREEYKGEKAPRTITSSSF